METYRGPLLTSQLSVNAGVTQDLCSILYTSVDEVVKLIQHMGYGTLLAKMDLKEAPTAQSLFTQLIVLSLQYNGVAKHSWTEFSRSASARRISCSQPLLMASYGPFSKKGFV